MKIDHHGKAITDCIADCMKCELSNLPYYFESRIILSDFYKNFRNRQGIEVIERTSKWHT